MSTRPPRRPSPGVAVGVAVGGVVVGILVFVTVASLIGSGTAKSHLGDDLFVVGRAARLRPEVEKRGPLLFQALVGRRDVYVQHLGDGRWTTFETVPRGEARECQLRWRPRTHDFQDQCTRRRYPADGAGLVHYPTRVDDKGKLVVDLRRPVLPPTTTTTSAPSTAP